MTPTFDLSDWQLFVYVLFSLFMLFCAWQGWLHGLGRCAMILVGVAFGYYAGKTLGFLIIDLYRPLLPYPEPVIQKVSDLIFSALIYFLFVGASVFLFKSTRKQKKLKHKIISGTGGVLFGILNGLVVTVFFIITIRVTGINRLEIPPQPGSLEYRQKEEVYLPEHLERKRTFAVNLYLAILNPPMEQWVRRLDPVPDRYYDLLLNFRILTQRDDLREAFLETEAIVELLADPEIAAILEGSDALMLLESGQFHRLVKNEAFRQLYQLPGSLSLMQSMDWVALSSTLIQESDLANHPDL